MTTNRVDGEERLPAMTTGEFGGTPELRESVDGVLSRMASAASFESSAQLLLSWLVERGDARGGGIWVAEGSADRAGLRQAFRVGDEAPGSLEGSVVAAAWLQPLVRERESGDAPGERHVALPLPRPLHHAGSFDDQRPTFVLPDQWAMAAPEDGWSTPGMSPYGAVVLTGVRREDPLAELAAAAWHAGALLAQRADGAVGRAAARELEQRAAMLSAMLHALPDPIVITDVQGKVTLRNRRAALLLEEAPNDSEGRRRAVEINHVLLASYLERQVEGGGAVSNASSRELNLVDPEDGGDLLFEVIALPLAVGDETPMAHLAVLRDVTDLRQAAHELERQIRRVRQAEVSARRERDRLDMILENVADPILVTDDRSHIIRMNRQAEQLFHLGRGDAEELEDAGDDGDARRRFHALRTNDATFTAFITSFLISGATSQHAQLTLRRPDGGELPVEIVAGRIADRRGEPTVIVSVLHDLTKHVDNERLYEELKRFSAELEERVRLATADLERQNVRLQWQSRELEKANRLKSEFLANMSHELRTPINALLGYTALMLDRIYGELNDPQTDALQRIRGSAQHLLELINDILDLAKIEAGKMPVHLEHVVLDEVLGDIQEQAESLLRSKPVVFTCEAPESAPPLYTDRTKLKQILLNLVSNAIKFTHQGRVTLAVTLEPNDRIRFAVSDTGIGMRDDDLAAIWEDFRQVDQSRTREYGGTGLGLSITRKLVERLEGAIAVESRYGEGSTFSVVLPVREPARVVDAFRRDTLAQPES